MMGQPEKKGRRSGGRLLLHRDWIFFGHARA